MRTHPWIYEHFSQIEIFMYTAFFLMLWCAEHVSYVYAKFTFYNVYHYYEITWRWPQRVAEIAKVCSAKIAKVAKCFGFARLSCNKLKAEVSLCVLSAIFVNLCYFSCHSLYVGHLRVPIIDILLKKISNQN